MFESISSSLAGFGRASFDRFVDIFGLPFSRDHRLFWVYLLTSALVALVVYRKTRISTGHDSDETTPSFLSYLFPKQVWSKPTAWLDLRFFVVNELTGKLLYVGLAGGTIAFTYTLLNGSADLVHFDWNEIFTLKGMSISIGYTLAAVTVGDFISFFVHYLQHKSAILWEFHKVHHSPEVMHPLSNFREHPVDNIFYSTAVGIALGVLLAAASRLFGYVPLGPELVGVPVFFLLFNVSGYHLRHSHIWLRWTGRWSMVFASPAHHHVHHSLHPDHWDKNFAFMLPIWDVLFRTYHMPEDNRDVTFGVYGMEEQEFTSISKIYFRPFANVWRDHIRDTPDAHLGSALESTVGSSSPESPEYRSQPVER